MKKALLLSIGAAVVSSVAVIGLQKGLSKIIQYRATDVEIV